MSIKSVLVVEEDPSLLEFCSIVLALDGFQVTSVSNGRQAVAQLKSNVFDLVLTDHIDGAGGKSMMEIVNSLRPEAGVVVMSNHPADADDAASTKEASGDYLAEPFKMAALTAAIRKCLGKKPST